MIRIFLNREGEIKFLEERNKEGNFECIVIYGRRRVGKTELIKQFIKNKPSLYFLADKRGTENNLSRFVKTVAEHFKEMPVKAEGFDDIFKYIKGQINKKRLIVVIDEFSYLVEKDDSMASVFQLIIDEILKDTNIFIILCGSSIGMMEKGVLSYRSPLYGRRTGQIKLNPLDVRYINKLFPNYSFSEVIEVYSILGGIPAYLIQFDSERSIFENIEKTFFSTEHVFYNEPEIILKEELREPKVYFNILEAIASGCTKIVDIANRARIEAKNLPIYMNILLNLDIIKKESPITEKKPKTKKNLYFIKDNFFRFWFKFILENRSKIEGIEKEEVLKIIKENLSSFTGKGFEEICKDVLWDFRRKNQISVDFNKVGRWWGAYRENNKRKTKEIDLVALNENKKEILYAECKWQNRINAEKIIKELAEKSQHVDWHNEKRKESFAVFTKSFSKRIKVYEGKKVYCFDLKDLEKLIKKQSKKNN